MSVKHVAVVGASGAVGERMIRLLEERRFPIASIKFLASARSAARRSTFEDEEHRIQELTARRIRRRRDRALEHAGVDLTAMEPDRGESPAAVVVDNSSAFRMDPDVPLVVPGSQPPRYRQAPRHHRQPELLDDSDGGRAQAVARCGQDSARRRLHLSVGLWSRPEGHSGARCSDRRPCAPGPIPLLPSKFAHPIFGNCIPQIDDFLPSGYTKEEMKMVNETRKIMGDATIDVSPTCVRVPVPMSHSESILVETERPISAEEARAIWSGAPGVTVIDDPMALAYPLAAAAAGKDDVFVGRIRPDLHRPNTLLFWCVSDNLRKGAATNAVQIAEKLLEL